MKCSILCIFTTRGYTFTFKDVELIYDNETMFQVRYSVGPDGKVKTATFPKATIRGWSVTV